MFAELRTSLKTTNALESIHDRVENRTAKVDHWKNSEQKQRWLATALLGSRTAAETHPELSGAPAAPRTHQAAAARRKEVGGVNNGSLTEFQLRLALTRKDAETLGLLLLSNGPLYVSDQCRARLRRLGLRVRCLPRRIDSSVRKQLEHAVRSVLRLEPLKRRVER